MAIAALYGAFKNFVMEWFGELRSLFVVATKAKLRLALFQHCCRRLLFDLIQQFFAKRHARWCRQMLKACQQPIAFILNLCIGPYIRFLAADAERRDQALIKLLLLSGIQPAGDSPPQDEPLDLALNLFWKNQAGHVNLSRLRHAPIINCGAESRTQAEAEEVEPARFKPGALLAPIGDFQHDIAELANGDLYLVYYGGQGEYAVDTGVFGSRLRKGKR